MAPGQAPCLTQNTRPEVPDFVCREAKCPLWSMLPVLKWLAAELGTDRGTGAGGRDRGDGKDRGNGSAGDDGRARPVTGTRLMAVTTENLFPGLRGNKGPYKWLHEGAQCQRCARSQGRWQGVCVLL